MTIEDSRIHFAEQHSKQPQWARWFMYVDNRHVGSLDRRTRPAIDNEPAVVTWLIHDPDGRSADGVDPWHEFETRDEAVEALKRHAETVL